jgi:hypothetical protein
MYLYTALEIVFEFTGINGYPAEHAQNEQNEGYPQNGHKIGRLAALHGSLADFGHNDRIMVKQKAITGETEG